MQTPPGYLSTLRAAVNAGALGGLFLGLLDGVVAAFRATVPLGPVDLLGCLAASVLVYGLLHALGQVVLSPLSHLLLRGRSAGVRYRILFGVAVGLGLCLELYWWSRPLLYYGLPATSPERLAVAAGSLAVGLVAGWLFARAWARTPRGLQRGAQALVLVLWVGGALFLLAQRGAFERSGRGELNERNRDLPNVLFIVVDALRADVLEPYGNDHVRTPTMQRLADEGVTFENAQVQAPFTWTSFGSWLTGKYPRRHGLMKMAPGVRMVNNVTLPWHLKGAAFREDSPQRAAGHERLDEKDFVGAAFMTGTLTHGSRLDRGFDVYCEALVGHELVELDSVWSAFSSELLLSIVKNKLNQQTDYALAATTAREWFERHGKRRFVSMVHLYSTHTPYDPPQEYREPYVDPDYAGPIRPGFYAHHRYAIEAGEYPVTPEEIEQFPRDVEHIKGLYYGGVTQADAEIGGILEVLERQGVLDDTLVVVTSDHGEDLGEGGRWEHNHMYQTNLVVPWILRWPRGLPSGHRVEPLVDSIDFLPTVCDLLGLELPVDEVLDEDRAKVDGVSLLPLIRGEVDSVRRYSFAENGVYLSIHDLEHKLIVRPDDGWREAPAGELEGARLFDLTADPEEEENLYGRPEMEDVLARLMEELRRFDDEMPIPRSLVVHSHRDDEFGEHLEHLGYAGGVTGESDTEPEPRRP